MEFGPDQYEPRCSICYGLSLREAHELHLLKLILNAVSERNVQPLRAGLVELQE